MEAIGSMTKIFSHFLCKIKNHQIKDNQREKERRNSFQCVNWKAVEWANLGRWKRVRLKIENWVSVQLQRKGRKKKNKDKDRVSIRMMRLQRWKEREGKEKQINRGDYRSWRAFFLSHYYEISERHVFMSLLRNF